MINILYFCMKMCTVIIVALIDCLTHLWWFGWHVWNCVLDKELQNSNAPSKIKNAAAHLYCKWLHKGKHMLTCRPSVGGKARAVTLACVRICFSPQLPGMIYSLLNRV